MSSEGSDKARHSQSSDANYLGRKDRKDQSTGRVVKAGSVKAKGRSAGHSSGHDRAASSGR